jgi:hypothetical protein
MADAGSPSNWDVTTVERFSSRKGRIWCGWRELLRSTGDERGLRLSHRGAVSFRSEKPGVQAAGNGPSEDGKCWQRVELGIHGLNRWLVKCREMYRNRGVQAARNGPSMPPTPAGGPVAKAEMSTADRLGSVQGKGRAGPGRAPAGEGRKPVGCVELAMTHHSASRCVFATHPTCWRPGNVVCP